MDSLSAALSMLVQAPYQLALLFYENSRLCGTFQFFDQTDQELKNLAFVKRCHLVLKVEYRKLTPFEA